MSRTQRLTEERETRTIAAISLTERPSTRRRKRARTRSAVLIRGNSLVYESDDEAGGGNRTRVRALEGPGFATKLRPRDEEVA
jgi:hypothetical protein